MRELAPRPRKPKPRRAMGRTRSCRHACAAPTAPAPGSAAARHGKGFAYVDERRRARRRAGGARRGSPSWASRPRGTDVWICPYPNGHLQATGTDAAGRKQYRYHDAWRARRDSREVRRHGRASPARCRRLRERVDADLGDCGELDRACVLALRRAAARARLLPHRLGGVRGGERVLRAGDACARTHVTIEADGADGLRLSRQERPAAAPGRDRRARAAPSSRRSSGGAAAATSCSPTRRAAAGTTCARRTSTPTSRRRPAATSRPRTSAPGTRPRSPRSRSPSPARRPAPDRRASAPITRAVKEVATLPRQHAGGLPRVLHRPARVRRLPGRARRSGRRSSGSLRGSSPASCRSTSPRSSAPCSTCSTRTRSRRPWSGSA